MLTGAKIDEDRSYEINLRPRGFDEYVGQEQVKAQSPGGDRGGARARRRPRSSACFTGPPGLGKTSLAYIIAREMGVNIRATSGPVVERPGDLAALLTNLEEGDILFIDEIHRLNHVVEEVLYPAMEDYQIDIMIGQGPSARSIKLDLKRFTLDRRHDPVGTVDVAAARSLRPYSRLDFYDTRGACAASSSARPRSSGALEQSDGIAEIARRSRGTPRIANRLLRRVRDYAQVKGDGMITQVDRRTKRSQMLEVDRLGLRQDGYDAAAHDRSTSFRGGPVGVDTLAAAIGEEKDTIEDVYEPFLIQAGFSNARPAAGSPPSWRSIISAGTKSGAAGSAAKKQPSLF